MDLKKFFQTVLPLPERGPLLPQLSDRGSPCPQHLLRGVRSVS
jgi:hypothetical protein